MRTCWKKASAIFANGWSAMDISTRKWNTRRATKEVHRAEGGREPKKSSPTEWSGETGTNCVGIEITGNHYFSTELLRSRLQIYGEVVRDTRAIQPAFGGGRDGSRCAICTWPTDFSKRKWMRRHWTTIKEKKATLLIRFMHSRREADPCGVA